MDMDVATRLYPANVAMRLLEHRNIIRAVLIDNCNTIVSLNTQSALIARIAVELGLGSAEDVVDPEASACDTTDPTTECP